MPRLNAVFQGGGVKGIGLVGALARVEDEMDVEFVGLAGTSAGSIVAALYAAGYTAQEMKEILMKTSFMELLDPYWFRSFFLWRKFGIHRGQKLYEWMYKLLKKKNVVTFGDLRRYDLRIIASDVQHRRPLVFDKEHYHELAIAEAVRMSIGIPLFFEAYRYGQSLVVDGGLLSNYPLWVFLHSPEPTLGFKLVSKSTFLPPKSPHSFPSFLVSLVSTMLDAHDKQDEKNMESVRTIHIPTHDISTTDFELSNNDKELLYNSGFLAASEYIKAHDGELVHPIAGQVLDAFASLNRLKKLSDKTKDTSYRATHVKRSVFVDPPDGKLLVSEELTNITDHPLHQIERYVATDAPTEISDLSFQAWVTIDGAKEVASVKIEPSKDHRDFFVTIGFKGRVLGPGKSVRVEWACQFPGSVRLNEDYWVFPVGFHAKPPDKVILEAQFEKTPADIIFYRFTDGKLSPMNLAGPIPNTNGGKPGYTYSVSTDSPVELFLLRWRRE